MPRSASAVGLAKRGVIPRKQFYIKMFIFNTVILAAFALTHILAGLLFGVKPRDPIVFGLVPMLLSAVALLAVWLPAHRASHIDPIDALRHE